MSVDIGFPYFQEPAQFRFELVFYLIPLAAGEICLDVRSTEDSLDLQTILAKNLEERFGKIREKIEAGISGKTLHEWLSDLAIEAIFES